MKSKMPCAVGVPLRNWLPVMLNPFGRAPTNVVVYGGVPPFTMGALYGVFTVPSGIDAAICSGGLTKNCAGTEVAMFWVTLICTVCVDATGVRYRFSGM